MESKTHFRRLVKNKHILQNVSSLLHTDKTLLYNSLYKYLSNDYK